MEGFYYASFSITILSGRLRVDVNPGIFTSTVTGNLFWEPIISRISYVTIQIPRSLQVRFVLFQNSSASGNHVTPTTFEPSGNPHNALREKEIGFPPLSGNGQISGSAGHVGIPSLTVTVTTNGSPLLSPLYGVTVNKWVHGIESWGRVMITLQSIPLESMRSFSPWSVAIVARVIAGVKVRDAVIGVWPTVVDTTTDSVFSNFGLISTGILSVAKTLPHAFRTLSVKLSRS